VPHDFGQLAGTDLVEEAIELDVLRNSRALAKQLDVIVERLLEIHDGEAIVIKQRRDISVMMIMKLLDDQLRRQGRRTAERVVNYHDVFDAKYIIHGRYALQSEGGASTCVSRDKQCSRGSNSSALFVGDDFSWVDFVPKILGDGLWDF